MIAVKEPAKRVTTYSLEGKENGFLTELFKDSEKTVFYLSCVRKNDFKGFHLHRVRAARYICVKGKIKIILYKNKKREEHILDSEKPERIFIPSNVATRIMNISDEDSWLINYPDPPYDPGLVDEQVEYTEEELKEGVEK
ncbi:MAG TPA: WxcM-like domain-containing protein [archaeon]|nr:WxcM-like domain-containing protein [archaeon]